MSAFPKLRTGAVLQYPAQRSGEYSTGVLQFVDGTEQRFPFYQAPLRSWVIRLSLLDETELHQLREFYRSLGGPSQNFAFTDPWDGMNYPSCSIEDAEFIEQLADPTNGSASLHVRENLS